MIRPITHRMGTGHPMMLAHLANRASSCDLALMIPNRPLATALLLSTAFFVVGACGDDGEGSSNDAADGEPCTEGADCQSDLCFVEVKGQDGVCRAMPAGCGEDVSCPRTDCLDDMKRECTGPGASCLSSPRGVTIECTPSE